MCHLILLLPVLALPVFWLLPWPMAVSVYSVVAVTSGGVYWEIARAMHRPVVTGREEMLHSTAEVVAITGRGLRVRVHGEVWNATSEDTVCVGDEVRVTGIDGLALKVASLGR